MAQVNRCSRSVTFELALWKKGNVLVARCPCQDSCRSLATDLDLDLGDQSTTRLRAFRIWGCEVGRRTGYCLMRPKSNIMSTVTQWGLGVVDGKMQASALRNYGKQGGGHLLCVVLHESLAIHRALLKTEWLSGIIRHLSLLELFVLKSLFCICDVAMMIRASSFFVFFFERQNNKSHVRDNASVVWQSVVWQ